MEQFLCTVILVVSIVTTWFITIKAVNDSFKEVAGVSYRTLAKEKKDCESVVIRANACVAVIYFEERKTGK